MQVFIRINMDAIDKRILEMLKKDGKATASEISKTINLSIPAVSERIRKLNEADIIQQYTVRVNRQAMGYHLAAMIFVSISATEYIQPFRKTIVSFPEVLECHHIAGEYDYLIKVIMADPGELEAFLTKKLKAIRGVDKTNTLVILSTLKETLNR